MQLSVKAQTVWMSLRRDAYLAAAAAAVVLPHRVAVAVAAGHFLPAAVEAAAARFPPAVVEAVVVRSRPGVEVVVARGY